MHLWYFFLLGFIFIACDRGSEKVLGQSTSPAQMPIQPQDSIRLANQADSIRNMVKQPDLDDTVKLNLSKQELPLRLALGNRKKVASCYYNIGVYSESLNLHDSLLHYYDLGLSFNPGAYYIYNKIGDYYSQKGDYESAISNYNRCLEVSIDSNDLDETFDSYVRLSTVSNYNKQYKQGLDYAELGLGLGAGVGESKLWLNKANSLLHLKKYHEAIAAYNVVSQDIALDAGEASICFTNTAVTFKYLGEYEKAHHYLNKALQYISHAEDLASVYNNMADIYLLQNRQTEAIKYYHKALVASLPELDSTQWRQNPSIERVEHSLSGLTILMGHIRDKAFSLKNIDPLLAIQTYQLADKVCDKIRKGSKNLNSKFFWREEAYPLYSQAIKLCFEMGNTDLAFYFFEKSRSAMLLDKLSQSSDDLYQKISETNTIQLEELQNKLSQNEAIIEYFTPISSDAKAVDSIMALVIYKHEIKYYTLYCPKDELLNFINSHQGVNGKNSEAYHLWWKRLIAPLAIDSNVNRLTFSTNGLLENVSFESLLEKPQFKVQNFLLSKYTVSYAYSATTKYGDSHSNVKPQSTFFVCAPTHFDKFNLPALEHNTEQKIRSLTNHKVENILIGDHATKKAFMDESAKHSIVQLFTHATSLDSTTFEPTIYFSDERLSLSEIFGLKLNAELFVLTACETNLGVQKLGEGNNSLAKAFAYAGVKSTLATMWSLPDASAMRISKMFFENLEAGMAKDEALRVAKIAFINEHGLEKINPYFWSAMVLIGNTTPIEKAGYPYLTLVVGAIGGLALLGAVISFRKKQ